MTLAIDETHDPGRMSWVPSANGHPDFPVQNLPYGIFSLKGGTPRAGVAIGEMILDLATAAPLLPDAARAALASPNLNALFELDREVHLALRHRLSTLLADQDNGVAVKPMLHKAASVTMQLPAAIGDYTDFYVGIHHANNIGRQLRPENPLLPNYKHVPIGYHGRASSIRPSGTALVRPMGQRKTPEADAPVFAPTRRLDYELELGVWIGSGNELGQSVPIAEAADHVAGFCLLNDWSARDFQAWEYQPLGPFLAKNFMSTVSPWVVTPEALAPFRLPQSERDPGDPAPLPYLWNDADQAKGALSIELEAHLATAAMRQAGLPPHRLSRGPATNMYWTVAQMIAHHTSNGCNLSSGDLLGSGTISAATDDGFGSLMEITRGGTQPIELPNGEARTFIEDGDEIVLTARARAEGYVPIGFGPCAGIVKPVRC